MCWYIVETEQGSVALDGELTAQSYYQAHRVAKRYASKPRPANPSDVVDRAAVSKAEDAARIRAQERDYLQRIGVYNFL